MDVMAEGDIDLETENNFMGSEEEKLDEESTIKLTKPKEQDEKTRYSAELLGSVITLNSPNLRTSARVIKKMKQDSNRPLTPPPLDKKVDNIRDEKGVQKTAVQLKTSKVNWSNMEKSLFFDALNEFGRDFEAIANFINSKLKRKNSNDPGFISKEQVRQTFYQTFHKVSKYIKFSDEVKKPVQEIYALVNYGEMRRRLTFVSEKNCMKIKDLVYKGHATVRSKGKTFRIKTPSCKALRKLNQLEDWLEDIKLPTKVEVLLKPATMESWGRVQNLAQNPVIRTTVPLQKKLVNVIKTFQYKWRSREVKMNEEALKFIGINNSETFKVDKTCSIDDSINTDEPLIRFSPSKNVVIHRPLVSITEYLSSLNICLNSYEERIGVQIRGETLCHEKCSTKRQRADSGCEKRSPEHKKCRSEQENQQSEFDFIADKNEKENKDLKSHCHNVIINETLVSDVVNDGFNNKLCKKDSNEVENHKNEIISDNNDTSKVLSSPVKNYSPSELINNMVAEVRQRRKDLKCTNKKRDNKKELNNVRPLLSDEAIKQIRKGWTVLNCGDITIGDLYIAFGHDSKLLFEYDWISGNSTHHQIQQNGVPYNANNNEDINEEHMKKITNSLLSNKLKHLLIIASLSENMGRKSCYCGHICEQNYRYRLVDNNFLNRSYVSNKTYSSPNSDNVVFRQPTVPVRRNPLTLDLIKRGPNGTRSGKPIRFLKSSTFVSKPIVVKRLPFQNGDSPEVEVKTLRNHFDKSLKDEKVGNLKEDQKENLQSQSNLEDNNDKMVENNMEIQTDNMESIDKQLLDEIKENPLQENIQIENEGNLEQTKCNNFINLNDTQNSSIEDVPDLSQLMDLPLPSPLSSGALDEGTNDSFISIPPLSPMQIIKDGPSDPKWLEENMNDFSLTSFFGHLDEITARDTPDNTNLSVIGESSVDYVTKFADLAASIQNEGKDLYYLFQN